VQGGHGVVDVGEPGATLQCRHASEESHSRGTPGVVFNASGYRSRG
jgi:hypothetical protein